LERGAPGIEALFDGVSQDGAHAILDFGSSASQTFRVHNRFARRIHFAGLLADPPHGPGLTEILRNLQPPSEEGFDLVLVWNLLDLLTPSERDELIGRIHQITAAGARLYVLVDASGAPTTHPMSFHLLGTDRVRQEQTAPRQPLRSPLLPADVERVLSPFRVIHAFTLRAGYREYVGLKGPKEPGFVGETEELR